MAKETPIRTKKSDAKLVKAEPVKQAQLSVVGAPELIVTKASDKGVSVVVRNVRLTWVFVKAFREALNDWTKGTKSVTLLVPKKSAQGFQRALADAVKQTIALNKKVVSIEAKKAAFATSSSVCLTTPMTLSSSATAAARWLFRCRRL